MGAGVLTTAMNAMGDAVAGGFGILGPAVHQMLILAMSLSYMLSVSFLFLNPGRASHVDLIKTVFKFATVGELINWFPTWSQALMASAFNVGARAAGGTMDLALNDPGGIIQKGADVIRPLMDRTDQLA